MSIMLSKQMEKCVKNLLNDVVVSMGEKYGFNGEEALRELNISGYKKKEVTKKEKREKLKVPVPFSTVNEELCCGVKKNRGLYTQCEKKKQDGDYCKGCISTMEKGKSLGDIRERAAEGDDWTAKDGKKAVHYTVVMKKLKLSREDVESELARCGMEMLSEAHFTFEKASRGRPKKTKSDDESSKKRGRPKKSEKAVEVSTTEDLFSGLIAEMKSSEVVEDDEVSEISSSGSEKSTSSSKKAAGGANKSVAKSEKQAAKAQEKAEKQAAKEAKAQEKAAKEQEKAEKQAAKAAKAQEKAEKQAAKAAKEQEKAEKQAAKEAKEQEKAEKQAAKEVKKVEDKVEVEKKEEVVGISVKTWTHNGVKYLKRSGDNIVYSAETHSVLGKWCREKDAIVWFTEKEKEEFEEEEEDDDELETEASDSESDSDSDEE
jgi:AT hook motif